MGRNLSGLDSGPSHLSPHERPHPLMGRHALGRVVVVGAYQRKGKQRDVLDILARLIAERNARKTPTEYHEVMPTRGTVTRHRKP